MWNMVNLLAGKYPHNTQKKQHLMFGQFFHTIQSDCLKGERGEGAQYGQEQ